jgi:O-antigen ligase
MITKRQLINTMYVGALPIYGFGFFHGARTGSISQGMIVSILPYILLIAVHLIDLMYRGYAVRVVNRSYWLAVATLVSMASGMWIALQRGFPGFETFNTLMQSLLILLPFQAAVVVQVVNREDPDFNFSDLFLKALVALVLFNFLGYAAGHSNLVHYFAGRINLPYIRGLYDAAHLLSIINLMLLFQIKDFMRRPGRFIMLLGFYLVNVAVMISVNSRLSFMTFVALTVLFLARVFRTARFVYPISLFTIPLLLSFALLIYEILTLPIFQTVLDRVSKEDVTSFNGRSYIWYAAWDWLVSDRRDFLFGAGYNGQYWFGLMDRIGVLWSVDKPAFIHMHSTSLQVLMAQGISGFVLMCMCMWQVFKYYRRQYIANTALAPLFAAAVYFLFIWQIDIFVYGIDIGTLLFFSLMSYFAVDRPTTVTINPASSA